MSTPPKTQGKMRKVNSQQNRAPLGRGKSGVGMEVGSGQPRCLPYLAHQANGEQGCFASRQCRGD